MLHNDATPLWSKTQLHSMLLWGNTSLARRRMVEQHLLSSLHFRAAAAVRCWISSAKGLEEGLLLPLLALVPLLAELGVVADAVPADAVQQKQQQGARHRPEAVAVRPLAALPQGSKARGAAKAEVFRPGLSASWSVRTVNAVLCCQCRGIDRSVRTVAVTYAQSVASRC
mmetsp:Transcript_116723/g.224955  ORF Transcript_116723/g.224955 Transcript_116723/m.224955 type:complete len:170 (-) Transcript_116723:675-1184(-)